MLTEPEAWDALTVMWHEADRMVYAREMARLTRKIRNCNAVVALCLVGLIALTIKERRG